MAGGVLSILAGIVTFFDSRRKYTIMVKGKNGEKPALITYDLKKAKRIQAYLEEKTTP